MKEDYHIYEEIAVGEAVCMDVLYIQHNLTKKACGSFTEEHDAIQWRLKRVTTERTFHDIDDAFKPEPNQERPVTFPHTNASEPESFEESIC